MDDDKEVYCVCGCGTKRPLSKMYHYGLRDADDQVDEVIGPVVKFHKLEKHRETEG